MTKIRSIPERGGYIAGDMEVADFPPPPGSMTVQASERPEDVVRRLAGKLAKLSDLHVPFHIYAECGHGDDEHAERGIDEVSTEDFTTCEDGYLYSICRSCCTREHDYQTEECAEYHGHTSQTHICPSRRILDEVST